MSSSSLIGLALATKGGVRGGGGGCLLRGCSSSGSCSGSGGEWRPPPPSLSTSPSSGPENSSELTSEVYSTRLFKPDGLCLEDFLLLVVVVAVVWVSDGSAGDVLVGEDGDLRSGVLMEVGWGATAAAVPLSISINHEWFIAESTIMVMEKLAIFSFCYIWLKVGLPA